MNIDMQESENTTITNSFHVVIRSAGERTTDLCYRLLTGIFPKSQVEIIEESPFSAAILKTFELGIASNKKWTICIDADVLVERKGLLELMKVAKNVSEDTWYVQGLTIDKFIPIIRSADNGIYRNSIVSEAIDFIPEDGTSLRPETTTMQAMISRSHKMYRSNIIVGQHDYEQSYIDILWLVMR